MCVMLCHLKIRPFVRKRTCEVRVVQFGLLQLVPLLQERLDGQLHHSRRLRQRHHLQLLVRLVHDPEVLPLRGEPSVLVLEQFPLRQ